MSNIRPKFNDIDYSDNTLVLCSGTPSLDYEQQY